MLSTAASTAALVYKNSLPLFSDNTLTVQLQVQSCNTNSNTVTDPAVVTMLVTVLCLFYSTAQCMYIIYNCYLYIICTDH